MNAGLHQSVFDASTFASGVYLYRMTAGEIETNVEQVFIRGKLAGFA